MNHDIDKMLTLSTSHVPQGELPTVAREAFADNEYGWLLLVGGLQVPGAPALARLVALARTLDCTWLRLDRDGQVREDLPVWEW